MFMKLPAKNHRVDETMQRECVNIYSTLVSGLVELMFISFFVCVAYRSLTNVKHLTTQPHNVGHRQLTSTRTIYVSVCQCVSDALL